MIYIIYIIYIVYIVYIIYIINTCILMKLNITLIKSIDLWEVSRKGLFNTLMQTSHKVSGYILAYSSSVNSISPRVYN